MGDFNWSKPRTSSIEYVLVDPKTNTELELLGYCKGGKISYNLNTALKVSADLEVDKPKDLKDNLLRIYFNATDTNGATIRYPLATLYASAPRSVLNIGRQTASIEGYSRLLRLKEEAYLTSYPIPKGTKIIPLVVSMIEKSGLTCLYPESEAKTTSQLLFKAGTSKLEVINELLSVAGFSSLKVNGLGDAVISRAQDINGAPPLYTFRDDEASIIYSGMQQERDWYSVPNVVICVCSSQDNTIVSTPAKNTDPNDPFSIPSRGREIVRVEEYSDVADKATLDAKAKLLLQTSSLKMESIEFDHAYIPLSVGDVCRLEIEQFNINGNYTIQSMDVELTQALKTSTRVRRFV